MKAGRGWREEDGDGAGGRIIMVMVVIGDGGQRETKIHDVTRMHACRYEYEYEYLVRT
jgi:hypothetical protein